LRLAIFSFFFAHHESAISDWSRLYLAGLGGEETAGRLCLTGRGGDDNPGAIARMTKKRVTVEQRSSSKDLLILIIFCALCTRSQACLPHGGDTCGLPILHINYINFNSLARSLSNQKKILTSSIIGL
jgi:hypothetical protein